MRLAQRLRQELLMTLAWIARRMHMDSVAYLINRLYLLRKERLKQAIIGPDLTAFQHAAQVANGMDGLQR